MTLLDIEAINSFYGSSHILHDVSLSVDEGKLVPLIGRNGAGKTTTLKAIMGMVTTRSGSIVFRDEEIVGLEPHEVSQRGIAYIPETRELFTQLTVEENLRLGYLGHEVEESIAEALEEVFRYFPRLEERRNQRSGSLSGGEQQMVAIARGLISDPDFLLIDEPTEGLMPSLVDTIEEILRRINEDGRTILLVEQNIDMALRIGDYGYVLDEGVIVSEGTVSELRNNQEVIDKYLTV